jgi:hypothetical protein
LKCPSRKLLTPATIPDHPRCPSLSALALSDEEEKK